MAVGEDAPQDDQAQAARAAAEARRRRILENRGQRLGVVAGEKPEEAAESTGVNRGAQAMRRRRMAQQKKKEVTTSSVEESGAVIQDTDDKKETHVEEPETSAEEGSAAAVGMPPSDSGEQRKYQGVARMRRKRLKEKQAAEAAKQPDDTKAQVVLPVTASLASAVPLVYIVLQLSSIFILFASGLHVGLFQHSVLDVNTVHWQLSPSQNGIGILQLSSAKSADIKAYFDTSNVVQLTAPIVLEEEEDEFDDVADDFDSKNHQERVADDEAQDKNDEADGTTDTVDAQSPAETGAETMQNKNVPKVVETRGNVDPLFQVDLDELTKGDGFLFVATRFAVRVHRLNLFVFYELPIKVAKTMWQLPSLLLRTPPVFCLLALTIRQATQRLGGNFTVQEKKQSKDLLAMAKGMVIQFLTGMFPTAVTLYTVWTNLRADMYIIMCGFFVGVAWIHTMNHSEIGMEEPAIPAGSDMGEL